MVSPVRLQNAETILREALRDAQALCGEAIDPRVQQVTHAPRSTRRQRAATVGAARPGLVRPSLGPVHFSLCAGDDEPMAPSDIDQVYAFDRSVGATGIRAATPRSPRHCSFARHAVDSGRPPGMGLAKSHSGTSLSTERVISSSPTKGMPPSTPVSEAKRVSKDVMVNATPGGVKLRHALAAVPSPTRSLNGRRPTRSGTISRSSSAGILLPPPRPVVRSTAANAEAGNGSKEIGAIQKAAGAPRQSPPRENARLLTHDAWRGSAGAPPPPSVSPRSPRQTRHLSVADGGPCRSPAASSKGAAPEASASVVDEIRQRVNREGVQLLPFTSADLLECAGIGDDNAGPVDGHLHRKESNQAMSRQSSSAAIAVEGPVLPLAQPAAGDGLRRDQQAVATRGPLPGPATRIGTCAEAASMHCAIVSSRLVNMLGRQSGESPGHQQVPPSSAATEPGPVGIAVTGLQMKDRIPRLERLMGSPPNKCCSKTDEAEVAVATETAGPHRGEGHSSKGKGSSKGETSALPGHMENKQAHSVSPRPLTPSMGSKGKGKGKGPPPRLSLPPRVTKRSSSTPAPTPRKPEVKPKTPMKRLFWSSFVLGDDVLAEKDATVWSTINSDCPDTFDQDELERMFGDATSRPGSARRDSGKANSGPSAPPQVAQRLRRFDESRRRQICVMLARLPPIRATVGAVQAIDTEVLGKDQVELLLANAPSAEELSGLQEVVNAGRQGEDSRWDDAEGFVLQLAEVPAFYLRLQVWAFENAFDERFALLQAVASEVFAACLALQKSPGIQRLLSLALNIGNYLNAGTPRGRADGFAIDGLAQMSTVKAMQAEAGGTLVDYLVRQLERTRPGELQGLFGEGGEASIVRKAARHKLPDSLSELDSCRSQAQSLARRAVDAKDEVLGSWGQRLETRLQELDDLRKTFDDAEAEYGRLCAWFHEGTSQKPRPSNEFLAVWDGFLQAVGVSLEALGASGRKKKAQHAHAHRPVDELKRSFSSCGEQAVFGNGPAR
mmetsp:Transcript_103106/g.204762  ORF Transcript_103106/g.204762 Transcript_103106/m.204762 type:complete len:1009 (-) Transcript_103106:52-3078(-)